MGSKKRAADYIDGENYNLALMEKSTIKRAIDLHYEKGHEEIAPILGISSKNLYLKLRQHDLKGYRATVRNQKKGVVSIVGTGDFGIFSNKKIHAGLGA